MKLIYENDSVLDYQVEVEEIINEATGKADKKYRFKGVFSTIGERNRNGRIYPNHIWEREVSNYQKELANGTYNTLLEWEHPARSVVDPMEAVAKIEKLYIKDGKYVMGEALLLNNDKANQLKSLIDAGVKISVSSRGVGKVGANGVVEDFKLICYDCVAQPSDFNATMNGMVESFQLNEGILEGKEFDVDNSGNIVEICGKTKCLRENRENVNKAVLLSFEKLFEASEEKVKGDENSEDKNKDNDYGSALPIEIRRLSIKNLIYILSKISGSDETVKVKELIRMLRSQEDTGETLETNILRNLSAQVLNKRYLKKSNED
jgi:hypothetical protein